MDTPPHTHVRVLYCTDTYPPQVNGVSVVTMLSVRGLASRGWQCAVVAPAYPPGGLDPFAGDPTAPPPEAARARIASIALPAYAEVRLCLPRYDTVRRMVRRFAPDLVHAETEFVIGRLGQIAAARAGIPRVSSYHTDFAKYAASYGMPFLQRSISRYLARFHRRSRRTYTPSAVAREYLRELGVPDVEVWGRGVDVRTFHPEQRSGARRLALGVEPRFTFLYAGRLAPEKGVDRILAAFAQVRAALPERSVHLVVAGEGPEERALRRAAGNDVTFVGYLDRREALPQLYASCDAFVFASLTETLGLVVLEAMASGLPVIAAPAGGVAEHLVDGVNGLATEPGSAAALAAAMLDVVQHPELAQRLATGARATAERLSWDAELDRLDASYRELVAPRAA